MFVNQVRETKKTLFTTKYTVHTISL